MRHSSLCGMLQGASSIRHMRREGEGAMVRRGQLIALVAFLIGCVVLLAVGCAATRSESPKKGQRRTEATREQTRSAKAASEEAPRCAETQLIDHHVPPMTPYGGQGLPGPSNWETNDVPGCPKGGPLLGTDSSDKLDGADGDDEIRGLGAKDDLIGGQGNDVIYGGPGNDSLRGNTWDAGLGLRKKGKTG